MKRRSSVEQDSTEPLQFLKGMFVKRLASEEPCEGSAGSTGWRIVVQAFLQAEKSRTQSHSPKGIFYGVLVRCQVPCPVVYALDRNLHSKLARSG